MVFVISDFVQGPQAPSLRMALSRVARIHDVVAIKLGSAAVNELPDVGWVQMTDPESGRRVVIDAGSRRVRERYRQNVRKAGEDLSTLLTEVGAELVNVDTEADPLALLADFFRRHRTSR
jgi:hypothetical protein